jgi:hypothetical protein
MCKPPCQVLLSMINMPFVLISKHVTRHHVKHISLLRVVNESGKVLVRQASEKVPDGDRPRPQWLALVVLSLQLLDPGSSPGLAQTRCPLRDFSYLLSDFMLCSFNVKV